MRLAHYAALLALAAAPFAWTEEAAPSIDEVLTELAAIGPEVLAARVAEMHAQVGQLNQRAVELRQQADTLEADAVAMQQRVVTIEGFVAKVALAMNPPMEESVPPEPAGGEAPVEEGAPVEEAQAEEATE